MTLRPNGTYQGGRRLALVALVVLALMLGACAQSGTESDDGAAPSQAGDGNESRQGTEQGTVVAEANGPAVEVFDAPDAPAPRLSLSNPTDNGGPRVFLVKERRGGWLNVALPVRPNGSTGWVREGDVTLSSTPYRVTVDLAGHQITVWEGDQVIVDEPVGVGKKDAPTPGGDYYLAELLQPPDPTTVYGPYAFGLSGFSDVFTNFAGGEGVIGIHGNNDPSTLGTDVSSGCIRMSNDGITRLAQLLPLGTPVTIV
ncbi:MAG: L,D-transpeptidase [Actinomycetota bacterium]|nr:L,D-transpeptidase [Actinomycetota bacterium]MDQ3354122.1 L,D-transpeptidase [Actinomycetota bacterium]